MAESKGRKVKKRSSSVDTSPGQVDTSDRSQRNMLTGLHLRSTPNQISLQEIPLAARRFSSLFLPSWCILKPNSHLLKQEKWQLIVEEAIGAPQGGRSSRSRFL
ncbi:hypothetical protein Taro_046064, partial [Colocasia esculenta]|nr:hypothetical protein [Colocasia esculenta]